jgi:3',5'-cyclic AMP phosphodiesterase CpdA
MNEIKINVIPDIHCKNIWKELVGHTSDMCVFLGDYTDSYEDSNIQMINNLLDIIQFKKDTGDKTILLAGNHDLPYMYLGDDRLFCSGHRAEIAFDVHDIFRENKDLFQNAFQHKKYIFTHAGIQNYWFTHYFKGDIQKNIADQLNNPKNREQEDALYQVGYKRWGRFPVGGIFWCDKEELKKPLKNYTQIVGHSKVKRLVKHHTKDATVLFCDYLDTMEEPLILTI